MAAVNWETASVRRRFILPAAIRSMGDLLLYHVREPADYRCGYAPGESGRNCAGAVYAGGDGADQDAELDLLSQGKFAILNCVNEALPRSFAA